MIKMTDLNHKKLSNVDILQLWNTNEGRNTIQNIVKKYGDKFVCKNSNEQEYIYVKLFEKSRQLALSQWKDASGGLYFDWDNKPFDYISNSQLGSIKFNNDFTVIIEDNYDFNIFHILLVYGNNLDERNYRTVTFEENYKPYNPQSIQNLREVYNKYFRNKSSFSIRTEVIEYTTYDDTGNIEDDIYRGEIEFSYYDKDSSKSISNFNEYWVDLFRVTFYPKSSKSYQSSFYNLPRRIDETQNAATIFINTEQKSVYLKAYSFTVSFRNMSDFDEFVLWCYIIMNLEKVTSQMVDIQSNNDYEDDMNKLIKSAKDSFDNKRMFFRKLRQGPYSDIDFEGQYIKEYTDLMFYSSFLDGRLSYNELNLINYYLEGEITMEEAKDILYQMTLQILHLLLLGYF